MVDEVCPTCHQSVDQQFDQPAGVNVPSLSPVGEGDMDGLLRSHNQMIQYINRLTGNDGARGAAGQAGKNAKSGRWKEVPGSRKTEKKKIYSKTDRSVFVEVERINAFTMKDTVTGNTFTWRR
jgi:hypothetical protein